MTTELLCRQSRVRKSQVQPLACRAIYLYDNRDPINQGHAFFFAFHFELTPFSDGQFSKVPAQTTVFNWEKYRHLTWETHEAGHRPADNQLSSPCPTSPSFRSFGTDSVMMCCFPPASSSTPLRPSVYYFLEKGLLINLVKVS